MKNEKILNLNKFRKEETEVKSFIEFKLSELGVYSKYLTDFKMRTNLDHIIKLNINKDINGTEYVIMSFLVYGFTHAYYDLLHEGYIDGITTDIQQTRLNYNSLSSLSSYTNNYNFAYIKILDEKESNELRQKNIDKIKDYKKGYVANIPGIFNDYTPKSFISYSIKKGLLNLKIFDNKQDILDLYKEEIEGLKSTYSQISQNVNINTDLGINYVKEVLYKSETDIIF